MQQARVRGIWQARARGREKDERRVRVVSESRVMRRMYLAGVCDSVGVCCLCDDSGFTCVFFGNRNRVRYHLV